VAFDHDDDAGFTGGGQAGVEVVMLHPEGVALFAGDEQGLVEQVGDGVGRTGQVAVDAEADLYLGVDAVTAVVSPPDLPVHIIPAEHVEDRATAVGGGDDVIGVVNVVVVEAHADGAIILYQDFLHLRLV
ncbi:hypothetical protein DC030_14730, partial [Enterococcus faecalis]